MCADTQKPLLEILAKFMMQNSEEFEEVGNGNGKHYLHHNKSPIFESVGETSGSNGVFVLLVWLFVGLLLLLLLLAVACCCFVSLLFYVGCR